MSSSSTNTHEFRQGSVPGDRTCFFWSIILLLKQHILNMVIEDLPEYAFSAILDGTFMNGNLSTNHHDISFFKNHDIKKLNQQMRKRVADFIRDEVDLHNLVTNCTDHPYSIPTYCDLLIRAELFAGDLELKVLSDLLDTMICIITATKYRDQPYVYATSYGETNELAKQSIFILYDDIGKHFSPLYKVNKNDINDKQTIFRRNDLTAPTLLQIFIKDKLHYSAGVNLDAIPFIHEEMLDIQDGFGTNENSTGSLNKRRISEIDGILSPQNDNKKLPVIVSSRHYGGNKRVKLSVDTQTECHKDERGSMMIEQSIQYSYLANRSSNNQEEPVNMEPIYSNEPHADAEVDVVADESVVTRGLTTKQSDFDLGMKMKCHNDSKRFDKTLQLFDVHMKKNLKTTSTIIITQALKACTHLEDLQRGQSIHQYISPSIKYDSYISTSFIHLYMQCGDVSRAESLFESIPKKSLSVYGAMIKGYIKNHQANKALELFREIKNPNEIILNLLFNACAEVRSPEALNLAKQSYETMPKSFQSNHYLLTSLIDAAMKCGDVHYAQSLFDGSPKKVLPMYGAMMKGYMENNELSKVIEFFKRIQNPSEVNTMVLFNACARLKTPEALETVRQVSKEMPKSFRSHSHLMSSLVDALIRCGDCSSAENVYSTMKKSVINYGNLMNGFNKENNPSKTLDLFNQMKVNHIEGNVIIYLCLIKALAQIGDYSISDAFVKQIPQSYLSDSQIRNALIDMWSKTGSIDKAKEIFDKISHPDHIAYTTMVNALGLNGMGVQAIELFRQIPENFRDEIAHICVLNACSHSGLVDEAQTIFERIPNKTECIYGAMIDCFSRASFFQRAQQLIDEYERDHSPVLTMYMALLSGARNVNDSHLAQDIYNRMKKLFPQNADPLTAAAVLLTNVYASSGDMRKASDIQNQLQSSGAKKKVGLSWTAVNGQLFQFRAHDRSHPRSTEIYAEIKKISDELIQHGFQYDSTWITRPLNEHETIESALCGHSERLAIAWNFVGNPHTKRIQVTKNLRVCGDCHRATKLIAAIRKCEIIVRDANRIHHFYTNGQCSCNDYF
ncbi:unnamed protein product [Adineta ricciae]|uniref:OTU domain-containing protein n=1 Tax=Adineta ricciae TaxID=249248 RepID=A0A813YL63_ADIRI|nr:unnamed protein product [Adineta ricciae]